MLDNGTPKEEQILNHDKEGIIACEWTNVYQCYSKILAEGRKVIEMIS